MAPKFGWEDGPDSNFDVTLVLATMLISRLHEGASKFRRHLPKFMPKLKRVDLACSKRMAKQICHPTEKDRNQEPQDGIQGNGQGFSQRHPSNWVESEEDDDDDGDGNELYVQSTHRKGLKLKH
ncbi:hypothetical protein K1719_038661 [Acacia pycnantha]|nr:hypothetical protein K1719_038661 [Acacia pycnantha]